MSSTSKRCKDCLAEGITTKRNAKYPGPRCASHHRKVRRERRSVSWERRIWETYKMTPERYWSIYEAQGRHCAFCPRNGKTKRLAIDHDHSCCSGATSCGRCVRGLLCTTCNNFLGHIRDRAEVGGYITEYLLNPPAQRLG